MVTISSRLSLPDDEVELKAIRSQGPGGQNVNKVSSAIHLRFDISASSLPDNVKSALKSLRDARINQDGIVVIKAQQFRTQEKNREDAVKRLVDLITKATKKQKARKPTKPTRAARKKRMDSKNKRGKIKTLRGKVKDLS